MSVITLLVVLMVLWQKVMRPMVEGYREAKPHSPERKKEKHRVHRLRGGTIAQLTFERKKTGRTSSMR